MKLFILCEFDFNFLMLVGKEVKEVIEPEIKRERFSTIVEETISINPDGFLDPD